MSEKEAILVTPKSPDTDIMAYAIPTVLPESMAFRVAYNDFWPADPDLNIAQGFICAARHFSQAWRMAESDLERATLQTIASRYLCLYHAFTPEIVPDLGLLSNEEYHDLALRREQARSSSASNPQP